MPTFTCQICKQNCEVEKFGMEIEDEWFCLPCIATAVTAYKQALEAARKETDAMFGSSN